MTKWFDTNYHYLVPELGPDTRFRLASRSRSTSSRRRSALGITTRPVLIGPVTYLLAGEERRRRSRPARSVPRLVPVYGEMLAELGAAGADWVQLDEPCLATDLDRRWPRSATCTPRRARRPRPAAAR